MLGSFWDAVAGKLADRWAASAGPAVVFWTGGAVAWVFAGSGWTRVSDVSDWFSGQEVAAQIAAILAALVVVAASAIVVQRLTTPVLRLLEGYWPRWMRPLSDRRRNRILQLRAVENEAWQRLQQRLDEGELTANQLADLARLEHRRHHRPVRDSEVLPTRIGNILRTGESRPQHRYGLDAILVWPRLWLVIPDFARRELGTARSSLDASVAAAIWGAAFVAFTPLAWWTAPLGIAVTIVAVVWWVPARAEVFADLIQAAYDLYRTDLYRQLRWPLPVSPADEQRSGAEITEYLVRGSDRPRPEFTPPRSQG
jgi:hypothetical protein